MMSAFDLTLIGAGLSLLVSLIAWLIQREKFKLSYTLTESGLFPTDTGTGKYYTIKVINNGNRLINGIEASISITDATVKRITDHTFIKNLVTTANQIDFRVDHLNAKEEFSFVITTEDAKNSTGINLSIRGIGATAKDRTKTASRIDRTGTIILCIEIGFLLGIITLPLLTPEVGSDKELKKPDHIENIFFVLNKNHAVALLPQLVTLSDDHPYASTALMLMEGYIKDSINYSIYISSLKDLALEDVTENTRGFIYYLIYKIDTRQKKHEEAGEYREKCKRESPSMYEHLMAHDMYFNLDSVAKKIIVRNK